MTLIEKKQNAKSRKYSLIAFLIMFYLTEQTLGLIGSLHQIDVRHLELRSDKDMIVDANYDLTKIMSLKINGMSSTTFTYILKQKDKMTIQINITYEESFLFQDAIITIAIPEAIKDASGITFDQTTYSTQIDYVLILSQTELTIQDIIPYLVWGFFGVFIISTISLIIAKIDTVGIWIVIDFFQFCGLFNYLSIVKSQPLIIYLSELNKSNFFFIPTWFYDLLNIITSNSINSVDSSVFIDTELTLAPSSTSFIRTTGNAIFVVFVYSLLTIVFSFSACVKLQRYFNQRSLYRIVDVLLIHFVFASVINLRFYSFASAYAISDVVLSILTLLAYLLYSTLLPCKKVNNADIIMLNKQAIDSNKHFINKIRVEFFFSRNYFFFRTLFRSLFTAAIALGTLNSTAAGTIQFITAFYILTVFFLNLRYSLYEDQRLNALQIISISSLFFFMLLFIILWCFEEFYRSVSRKSSSQIDSTYITFNHYLSWILICLIIIAKISFLTCLFSYLYSSRKDKIQFQLKRSQSKISSEKTQNDLNLDLIEDDNTINANGISIIQNDANNINNNNINNINVKANINRDIEMTRQVQNSYDISTMQSQIFESPQKLMNPQNKQQNSSGFQVNMDGYLNTQPNQKQFDNMVSLNHTNTTDFNTYANHNHNESQFNTQLEQDQDIRFQAKTSTFQASKIN